MRKSPQAVVAALVVCCLGAARARADAGPIGLFARVDPSVSIPLGAPQSDRFYPGFQSTGNFGVGFRWIDLKLTALVLVLPEKGNLPATETSVSVGLGGGFRLKLPSDLYRFTPWIDVDALYARTTDLNRFAFSVAAGVNFPVGARQMWRIGPVVRFTQIVNSDHPQFDDRDARLLSIGLSVEFDGPRASSEPAKVAEASAPPPRG